MNTCRSTCLRCRCRCSPPCLPFPLPPTVTVHLPLHVSACCEHIPFRSVSAPGHRYAWVMPFCHDYYLPHTAATSPAGFAAAPACRRWVSGCCHLTWLDLRVPVHCLPAVQEEHRQTAITLQEPAFWNHTCLPFLLFVPYLTNRTGCSLPHLWNRWAVFCSVRYRLGVYHLCLPASCHRSATCTTTSGTFSILSPFPAFDKFFILGRTYLTYHFWAWVWGTC